jgi:hypothetical protein
LTSTAPSRVTDTVDLSEEDVEAMSMPLIPPVMRPLDDERLNG